MNYDELLARLRAGGALTLDQMRYLAGEIATRAAAMPGQITAETPPEDAARIEREHADLLADNDRLRLQITDAERTAATPPPAVPTVTSAEVQAALAAERSRVNTIRIDGRAFGMTPEFVERHIGAGTSETDYRLAVLDEMRRRSEINPTFGHATITRDETESRRAGMTAAIVARLARANGERVELPVIAQPWAERELIDIAAECVGWRGALRTARQVSDMLQRAFLTTSDFPDIFTNALNVRLLARYATAAPTYRTWAANYNNPDFRASNVIRAGDFPSLKAINETGEIESGSFSESKETHTVAAYGRMLNISRVMMVNDQLGAIEQVLGSAGQRVADWENVQAYTLLLSASGAGPTLATDSTAVFHTDHGNLAGTAAAISVTSVGAGRAAMMKQTTLDGLLANFTPTTILVGPDKLTEAEQLLTAITPAQPSNAVPEAMRRLTPVADANITGNAWYLFAAPGIAPCFVYGYLNGFEGPRLSSEDVFDVQGMRVKLEHDFGVSAIDYRGGYRNAGA